MREHRFVVHGMTLYCSMFCASHSKRVLRYEAHHPFFVRCPFFFLPMIFCEHRSVHCLDFPVKLGGVPDWLVGAGRGCADVLLGMRDSDVWSLRHQRQACVVLCCVVLCCVVLCCVVLCCVVLCCIVSCRVVSCRVSYRGASCRCRVMSCLVVSYLASSRLILPRLILPRLAFPCLSLPCLVLLRRCFI
jgi:hypothetical protein